MRAQTRQVFESIDALLASATVAVATLFRPDALLEVDITAVVPGTA